MDAKRTVIVRRNRRSLASCLLSNQTVVGFIMIVVLVGAMIIAFKATEVKDVVHTPVVPSSTDGKDIMDYVKYPEPWHPPLLPVGE